MNEQKSLKSPQRREFFKTAGFGAGAVALALRWRGTPSGGGYRLSNSSNQLSMTLISRNSAVLSAVVITTSSRPSGITS